jgi:hypothetical protein
VASPTPEEENEALRGALVAVVAKCEEGIAFLKIGHEYNDGGPHFEDIGDIARKALGMPPRGEDGHG